MFAYALIARDDELIVKGSAINPPSYPIKLLANDYDPDGDPIAITASSQPRRLGAVRQLENQLWCAHADPMSSKDPSGHSIIQFTIANAIRGGLAAFTAGSISTGYSLVRSRVFGVAFGNIQRNRSRSTVKLIGDSEFSRDVLKNLACPRNEGMLR